MSWFKFDDNAVDHPKVRSLSNLTFRWWVKGMSYASRFLTNGVLPKVFWKEVPKQSRAELTQNRLWNWIDPHFEINDYLLYQTAKEDVEADKERNRENSKAYRDRRKNERRQRIVSADASADRQPIVSPPVSAESATQRTHTHTENREQRTEKTTTKERGVGLIVSPLQFARLQESHAYVGAKLRVPNALHSELIAKSGANADQELRSWYARLDEELETSGKATGDVFQWLRPRHQAFAIERGWIDAAPKATRKPAYFDDEAALDAKLAAIEARGKR